MYNFLLARSYVIAVETDTVPGLLADAANNQAIRSLYKLKGRPHGKPLQIMVGNIQQAQMLAFFSEEAKLLAQAFWPGPLTLVLPRREDAPISPLAVQGRDTVGIRIPDSPELLKLLKLYKRPMVATSANKSGQRPLAMHEVEAVFKGKVQIVHTRRAFSPAQQASTVAILEGKSVKILREGAITKSQLLAALV